MGSEHGCGQGLGLGHPVLLLLLLTTLLPVHQAFTYDSVTKVLGQIDYYCWEIATREFLENVYKKDPQKYQLWETVQKLEMLTDSKDVDFFNRVSDDFWKIYLACIGSEHIMED